MYSFVPQKMVLTKGVGYHKEKLSSFEMALRDADIARFNLVAVSSIFPPNCRIVPKKKGLTSLSDGQVVYCVKSQNQTNENRRLIASSVGIAIPKDHEVFGYLSEHHSFGETDDIAGDYAEDLAAEMLATVLGLEFDTESSWDERKDQWKISDKIVRTMNITQSAMGPKDGSWVTVIAAAVFIP